MTNDTAPSSNSHRSDDPLPTPAGVVRRRRAGALRCCAIVRHIAEVDERNSPDGTRPRPKPPVRLAEAKAAYPVAVDDRPPTAGASAISLTIAGRELGLHQLRPRQRPNHFHSWPKPSMMIGSSISLHFGAQLCGDPRPIETELRQVQVHLGDRRDLRDHGEMNLRASLRLQVLDEFVAIDHPAAIDDPG